MSALSLAPLLGAILNGIVAVLVLTSDPRSRINRTFFAWGLSVTIWNLGTFALFVSPSDEVAHQWARIMQFGVIFIPVTLFHLSLLLAEVHAKRVVFALYGVALALAASNCAGKFINGVRFVGYAYYSVAGVGFWIYTLTFAQTMVSIIVLLRRRKQMDTHSRRRLDGLILAQVVLVTLGSNDILPIIGIDHYPFTNAVIFPYGSIAAIFYGAVVAYSTLHHQLLNVHVTLGRSAAHLVRFVFLFAIGITLQLIVAAIAPQRVGSFEIFTSLGVLLISTLTASMLFPRLLGVPSEQLERRMLGDRFEYQDQVRNFIVQMSSYPDLAALLNELHTLLTRTFKFESYRIILSDESKHSFSLVRSHPEELPRAVPTLTPDSAVFRYFEWGQNEYLSLTKGYSVLSTSPIERQAQADLAHFKAQFCFPLVWQTEPFGLLLVGEKENGGPFTANDVNLLADLAQKMSLVANQLRLKTQILEAQELDLLGRISKGMAHDLNNLLTPVSTLLQLASETGYCDDELLPTALRNVTTMRAYIKESLFFSEHPQPDLRLGRLDMVIKQTVELARSTRKKSVEITAETPTEVLIEMNEVLVQRLLTNIISNAIDASTPETLIQVKLERLSESETQREWLRLRVIDQGEGISRENLERVQTPYFTTKNHGDETRGFGLGLAICRKIVTLHGGRLSIESQLGKGTTVQVDLPSRQLVAESQSTLTLSTSA
ncbi:ATP-binding protein [Verrucomicrobiota bacterium sgz303538]